MSHNNDDLNRKVSAAWLPRFSLRQFLIAVTAICVVFSIAVAVYRQYTLESRIVYALGEKGGLFTGNDGEPHILGWGGLALDPYPPNYKGGFYHLDEKDIDNINQLGDIAELSFLDTNVTDELTSRLRPFKGLKRLRLFGSKVTCEGVQQLPSFLHLELLEVSRKQVPEEIVPNLLAKFPGVSIRILGRDSEGNIIVKETIVAGEQEELE